MGERAEPWDGTGREKLRTRGGGDATRATTTQRKMARRRPHGIGYGNRYQSRRSDCWQYWLAGANGSDCDWRLGQSRIEPRMSHPDLRCRYFDWRECCRISAG